MTPPAAATVAGRPRARHPPRTAAPRIARRVSGPARPARHGSVALPVPAGHLGAPPLGLRIVRRVAALPDARVLDRLIRGRLWIGLLAVGLIGIVFMQISLLKLNTGIGRAVESAQTLEQQNATLRADLSGLADGARVQDAAKARGYVVPAVGQPSFLDAGKVSAAQAAAAITKPAPVEQLPLGMISPSEGGTAGLAPVTPAAGAVTGQAAADTAAGAPAQSTTASVPAQTTTAPVPAQSTTAGAPATVQAAGSAPAAAAAPTASITAAAQPAAAAAAPTAPASTLSAASAGTARATTAGGVAAPLG